MTLGQQTIILAAATIAAVLLGVLLTYVIEWARGRIRRKHVRTMLASELNYNLAAVKDCWNSVREFYIEGQSKRHQNTPLQIAEELSAYPELSWSRTVFDGSVEWLPVALKGEEISEVLQFFARLEALSAIQARLKEQTAEIGRLKERRADARPVVLLPTATGQDQTTVDLGVRMLEAHPLVRRFTELTEALIERGNPVGAPETKSLRAGSSTAVK